ncbi:hypothetical protein CGMCC3_g13524 [Colletotrichum fructicola]|nr:uncharacterized protein CGMCC3_g13524 [Colletotrichum fructicola]KAE9570399.1 hypothetical protein CGMCC3_g13524 [Colletotrichum fructicola]
MTEESGKVLPGDTASSPLVIEGPLNLHTHRTAPQSEDAHAVQGSQYLAAAARETQYSHCTVQLSFTLHTSAAANQLQQRQPFGPPLPPKNWLISACDAIPSTVKTGIPPSPPAATKQSGNLGNLSHKYVPEMF